MPQAQGISIHQTGLVQTKESCHQDSQSLLTLRQGWVVNQVRAGTKRDLQFNFGLPIQPLAQSGQAHPKQVGVPTTEASLSDVKTDFSCQIVYGPYRASHCNRETCTTGPAPYETHPVAHQETLPESLEKSTGLCILMFSGGL